VLPGGNPHTSFAAASANGWDPMHEAQIGDPFKKGYLRRSPLAGGTSEILRSTPCGIRQCTFFFSLNNLTLC